MSLIKALITLLAAFVIVISGASAQTPASPTPVDYQLPFPGVLPDHPLYPVKRFRDWLLITFNRKPLKKAEIYLLLSDKKMSMASFLLDKGKPVPATVSLMESQTDLLKSVQILPGLKSADKLPEGFADKISLAGQKHLQVISEISLSATGQEGSENIKQAVKHNKQADTIIESLKE